MNVGIYQMPLGNWTYQQTTVIFTVIQTILIFMTPIHELCQKSAWL